MWEGVTGEGVCHCSGVRRGARHLPNCLILAWACLLCGSPTWYLPSQGLVQEDLNTRDACRCQHGSQARDLWRCLLWSMSVDQSGSCLPLLVAVAALISPSVLAEEQCPFQNMAQLLWLDFAWRCTPHGPGSGPVLDLQRRQCYNLFHCFSLLPVTLSQAIAPVPPLPNFLFNSELLEHL